jgi:hypothetical protein
VTSEGLIAGTIFFTPHELTIDQRVEKEAKLQKLVKRYRENDNHNFLTVKIASLIVKLT